MIVKMKTRVDVPYGYYCDKCRAAETSKSGNCYCKITGRRLQITPRGRTLKTDECFSETKAHLMNGGK